MRAGPQPPSPSGPPPAPAPAPCAMTDHPPNSAPAPAPVHLFNGNGNGHSATPATPPTPTPPAPPSHPPSEPSHHYTQGGRLKFFKDGKFILELETRDGDRWVSVPRKTFWPPPQSTVTQSPASASLPSIHHQERAASLSVSDDNSSLQSSPWQRDHYWKQVTPRRGLSKEMNMLYVRLSTLPAGILQSKAARLKRRRPLDQSAVSVANGSSSSQSNGSTSSPETPSEDAVDSATPDCESKSKHISVGKFKFFKNIKCESNSSTNNDASVVRVYKKSNKKLKRRELGKIVEALTERLPLNFTPVNAKISALNCKPEHMMVSPRKRILREFERVTLEDVGMKKSKALTGTSHSTSGPQAGPSHAQDSPAQKHYNGVSSSRRDAPPSKPVNSSYSINSLLSITDEKRSTVSVYKTESPDSIHSPDPSPSPEHPRRMVTMSRSSPVSYNNSRPKYYYPEEVAPVSYHMYPPYHIPHSPYMNAYSGYTHPRALPLWLHPQYPPIQSGPWVPLAHPLVTDHPPRDDASSDLPLNLSKH